jgi:hypothetical protein
MNKTGFLVALATFCMSTYSCTYRKKEFPVSPIQNNGLTNGNSLPDTVSFALHVLPILRTECATSNCHSGNAPASNLNLENDKAHAQISNSYRGYLNTTQPTNSLLYNLLTTNGSKRMPPNKKLEQIQIDLIVKWMAQGALNK